VVELGFARERGRRWKEVRIESGGGQAVTSGRFQLVGAVMACGIVEMGLVE